MPLKLRLTLLLWSGHSCPLLLILILILQGARTHACRTVEERRFSAA